MMAAIEAVPNRGDRPYVIQKMIGRHFFGRRLMRRYAGNYYFQHLHEHLYGDVK